MASVLEREVLVLAWLGLVVSGVAKGLAWLCWRGR
jgi:hypothetical protein